MQTVSIQAARREEAIGEDVEVRGWIRTRRDSKGGFSFLEVNDGSSLANLQVIADAELSNYETEIKRLSAGASVAVRGQLKESGGRGQATELHAREIVVYGWADPDSYPLQKKRHSFEKLREWAHLRPRTNSIGAVMRVRSRICRSIHDFFADQEFLYIQTPIITASDCEGAGELFRVTTIDPARPPLDEQGQVDWQQDFFDRPAFLTVSGQLEGEIYASALGKIYTFGPTFRAENSNTSRHLAEFWMVEPEAAFYELPDVMDLAESFLKRIANDVLKDCSEDLEFFNQRIDDQVLGNLERVAETPFHRVSYSDAIDVLQKSGKTFEFPVDWGADLQAEHERYLAEEHYQAPVILHDFPKAIKPFYMRVNDDDRTVAAMDVLAPGVGEIIGGSQREERLDVLTRRMEEQDLSVDDYWWYVDLRRYGTTPHSGFGLGLERMVQFVTGMANIRDVIPFPRTPGNAEF